MPKNYTIQDDTTIEIVSLPFQIPLHALYASKHIYANYPDCQRQEVWPDRFKFDLIDSLVKGLFVPEILLTARIDGEDGKWVIDGQQRLQTMLQFFEALESDLRGEPVPRDENGNEYFYFRLTKSQEQRLRSRMIKFTELQNVNEDLLAVTFLRLQNQVSLSPADKLWASRSQFRNIAAGVYEHPFFNERYQGKTKHRQAFQMAVYPVLIEMFKPFADMGTPRIRELSGKKRDDLVYPGLEENIYNNLDLIMNLYDGINPLSMTEMVVMYQSIWLLKFLGIDLTESPHGSLGFWYKKSIIQDPINHRRGGLSLYSQMTRYKVQREVWARWLDDIVYGNYLYLGDEEQKKSILAQLQRVTGWLRHDRICPGCRNAHIRLIDVEKHVFRPSDEHLSGNCHDVIIPKQLAIQSMA